MRPVEYIACLHTVYIAARGWVTDVPTYNMYIVNVLLVYVRLARACPNYYGILDLSVLNVTPTNDCYISCKRSRTSNGIILCPSRHILQHRAAMDPRFKKGVSGYWNVGTLQSYTTLRLITPT